MIMSACALPGSARGVATAPRASANNLCGLGSHVLGKLVGEIAAVLFAVRGLLGRLRNLCVGPLAVGFSRLSDVSAMLPGPVRMLFGGIVCHGPNLPACDWG